jgi:hypothetical protein
MGPRGSCRLRRSQFGVHPMASADRSLAHLDLSKILSLASSTRSGVDTRVIVGSPWDGPGTCLSATLPGPSCYLARGSSYAYVVLSCSRHVAVAGWLHDNSGGHRWRRGRRCSRLCSRRSNWWRCWCNRRRGCDPNGGLGHQLSVTAMKGLPAILVIVALASMLSACISSQHPVPTGGTGNIAKTKSVMALGLE